LKLSKTSWLILSIGVFVVVVAGLGLTRSQQLQAQTQLNEELGVAEMRLNKLGVEELRLEQEDLQRQLDERTIELDEAKNKMRQTIESIDVTDEFFEIAESCYVQINSISSSEIRDEKYANINCSMITLNAIVEGEVSDIIDFVIKLNSEFTTGIVESAHISIPEITDEEEPEINVNMVVYTYRGK
jgi:regulator of replication initiation timing